MISALKSVAGSLAGRLKRAPLNSYEVPYLRGIANLKLGKRLTKAQALAVLSASRGGSPLFLSVFGKREQSLIESFLEQLNRTALKRSQTPSSMMRWAPELPPYLAVQLADAFHLRKSIFYKPKHGAVQKWSVEGFRRFITNPIYKARRGKVFSKGTFFAARGDTLPPTRKGRTKLIVK